MKLNSISLFSFGAVLATTKVSGRVHHLVGHHEELRVLSVGARPATTTTTTAPPTVDKTIPYAKYIAKCDTACAPCDDEFHPFDSTDDVEQCMIDNHYGVYSVRMFSQTPCEVCMGGSMYAVSVPSDFADNDTYWSDISGDPTSAYKLIVPVAKASFAAAPWNGAFPGGIALMSTGDSRGGSSCYISDADIARVKTDGAQSNVLGYSADGIYVSLNMTQFNADSYIGYENYTLLVAAQDGSVLPPTLIGGYKAYLQIERNPDSAFRNAAFSLGTILAVVSAQWFFSK